MVCRKLLAWALFTDHAAGGTARVGRPESSSRFSTACALARRATALSSVRLKRRSGLEYAAPSGCSPVALSTVPRSAEYVSAVAVVFALSVCAPGRFTRRWFHASSVGLARSMLSGPASPGSCSGAAAGCSIFTVFSATSAVTCPAHGIAGLPCTDCSNRRDWSVSTGSTPSGVLLIPAVSTCCASGET